MTAPGPAVVALGGGHGLAASLSALRRVTRAVTAVVTVADDGGSSGRLRTELGALPPGDLRMALAALAGQDSWSGAWASLFQYRFPGDGPLAGHPVGNLVITALADQLDDPVAALDFAGRLLGIAGRVLPLAVVDVDIEADVTGLDPGWPNRVVTIRGQHQVATTPGRVRDVRLVPSSPPACRQAVTAIRAADWVILGPGSLFTSVIPHLLVPDVAEAVCTTSGRRAYVLNLAAQAGETAGFSPQAHLEAIARQAPLLRLDVVIADPAAVPEPDLLEKAAADIGAQVHFASVSMPGEPQHDPNRLAVVFRDIFTGFPALPVDPSTPHASGPRTTP